MSPGISAKILNRWQVEGAIACLIALSPLAAMLVAAMLEPLWGAYPA